MKLLVNVSAICMDYFRLAEQSAIINSRADMLHFDLMDGHFIPRLGLHPDFAAALAEKMDIPLDIHLLCTRPMDYAETMAKAVKPLSDRGQQSYFVPHIETLGKDVDKELGIIKSLGFRPGLAIFHDSGIESLIPYLSSIEKLTFLTRDPKSSNTGFIPEVLEKIHAVSRFKQENSLNFIVETDGPCDDDILVMLLEAGVESIVVGNSFLFKNDSDLTRAWDTMDTRIKRAEKCVKRNNS